MKYALLIFEAEVADLSEVEQQAVLTAHQKLQAHAKSQGAFLEANQLQPSSAAVVVRQTGNDMKVTDGPFVETKEQLIGYYLLECSNIDEVLEYARFIPQYHLEIRPIVHLEQALTKLS